MSMNLRPGDTVVIAPKTLADELKGKEWGYIDLEGVTYDAEFTGAITPSGSLVMKIKRKSQKQLNK